jgi:DedD protein
MPDNDEALDLRRRARRRLVGAIALVVALVLIPPWVMDLEPKPVATDLTVEIPKQEPGGLRAPSVPAAPASPASGMAPDRAPAPGPGAAEGVPRPPDVKPESGLPGEKPRPEAAKPAPKPAAVARAASPESARKSADAKRAEAILNEERFVVPLGAFANKENVKQLEARLAKAGVKYFTETVTTPAGEQTRVRAGPFPSRDAAEQTREKLKGLGLSPGNVIARQ